MKLPPKPDLSAAEQDMLERVRVRLIRPEERAVLDEVLVGESYVDSLLFRGPCYKASGWTLRGQTQGFGRTRQDYYVEHERPKQ